MRWLLVLLAACDSYAHLSMHNAPGVTNLAKPMANENGDPVRYELAASAGSENLAVFPMPYVIGGVGRNGGGGETGLEMRFEHSSADDDEPLALQGFGVTLGAASAQWHDNRTIFGALYAELNYRGPISGWFPLDLGLGPVAYAESFEFGGQLTLRFPLFLLRLRYLPDSRFEVMVGTELPFPFLFRRSR